MGSNPIRRTKTLVNKTEANMEISLVYVFLVVAYVLGTMLGIYMGFRNGVIRGSSLTVDLLLKNNFIRSERINGEIHLKPLSDD